MNHPFRDNTMVLRLALLVLLSVGLFLTARPTARAADGEDDTAEAPVKAVKVKVQPVKKRSLVSVKVAPKKKKPLTEDAAHSAAKALEAAVPPEVPQEVAKPKAPSPRLMPKHKALESAPREMAAPTPKRIKKKSSTALAKATPTPAAHESVAAKPAPPPKMLAKPKATPPPALAAAPVKPTKTKPVEVATPPVKMVEAKPKPKPETTAVAAPEKAKSAKAPIKSVQAPIKSMEAPVKVAKTVETQKEPKPASPSEAPKTQAVAAAAPASQSTPKPVATPMPAIVAASSDVALKSALAEPPSRDGLAKLRQVATERRADPAITQIILMRIGEVSLALDDPKEAILAYRTATQQAPDKQASLLAQAGLIKAAGRAGNFPLAAAQWAELRKSAPQLEQDSLALNGQALALAAANDYQGASKLWQQMDPQIVQAKATKNPDAIATAASALMGQALAADLQGQGDLSRKLLNRIIQEYYTSPEAALARKRLADLDDPLIQ